MPVRSDAAPTLPSPTGTTWSSISKWPACGWREPDTVISRVRGAHPAYPAVQTGQMQPGMANLLVIHTRDGTGAITRPGQAYAGNQKPGWKGKDPAFYEISRY